MTLPIPAIPYGLRDVKLRPIADDGTLGSSVDLPAVQTLDFNEAEDFDELAGDDTIVASHGHGPLVSWTLNAGGISLEAYAVMAGGTVTVTGTGSSQKKTYHKTGTGARPYFQIEGQAIGDNGGDVHGIIYRAKAEGDIGGSFAGDTFFVTNASGRGLPDASDNLYDFVHNATAAAIT
jgi:hypothetical protein